MEKSRLKHHNCISILKNKLDVMSERMTELKSFYARELSSMKSQLQRRDREMESIRAMLERQCPHGGAGMGADRQMVSFSCVGNTEAGAHEMIFIQTIHLTLQCEASMHTKIGQIKYNASSIANLNTTDFSLFHNGQPLQDHSTVSQYNIHNGSICHLLPNQIYITFDCIDIKQIIGFSVRTSDTIQSIIGHLNLEIQKVIPSQLYQYLKRCSCGLYFGDSKLEETYQLSNYDVLNIQTLKFCNRLLINV